MARSSPRCPGTVTNPRFDECLNCRWLPRIRTWYQPSVSSSRMTSLTFMGWTHLRYNPLHNDQAQPRTSRVAGWPSAGATGYVLVHHVPNYIQHYYLFTTMRRRGVIMYKYTLVSKLICKNTLPKSIPVQYKADANIESTIADIPHYLDRGIISLVWAFCF